MIINFHKKKLIVSIFFIFVLGLTASTIISYNHVKSWIVIAVKDEQLNVASVAQTATEQWFASAKTSMQALADKAASFDGNIENNDTLQAIIYQYTQSSQFDYVSISLESTGYYQVNDWDPPIGYDPRDRLWYQEAKKNKQVGITGPYSGVAEYQDTYYLSVTAPIMIDDRFIGVVSGDILANRLSSLFAQFADAETLKDIQHIFIVDKNMHIIGAGKTAAIGQKLNAYVSSLSFSVEQLNKLPFGGEVYLAENSLVSIVPIPSLDAYLSFEMSSSTMNSRLLAETVSLLGHFLIIFLLVTLAFYFTNRKVIKPLFDSMELDNEMAIPNKKTFKQIATKQYIETRTSGMLLIINLDSFNAITAAYSSSEVRQLLNQVKHRVEKKLGESALLGVFSESRLVAYIPCISWVKQGSESILSGIVSCLDQPFYLSSREVNLSAHIGASHFPDHGADIEELINHAFTAYSVSKKFGGADYSIFSHDMKAGAGKKQIILSALKNGLRKQEFFMLYQPQIDTRTNSLMSVEALVRWRSTELERVVSPAEFIPIVESSELVGLFGLHVIELVFQQINNWHDQGVYIPKVAINISPNHLLRPGFCLDLEKLVNQYQIDVCQIELELTETSVMDNPEAGLKVLHQLKQKGFSLAIDDFGSGYSSFQYLKVMPVDKLKIDRIFIKELENDLNDQAIIQSLVAIANNLNFSLLAEGVETEGQLNILTDEGIFFIQGFLFAKPQTADEITSQFTANGFIDLPKKTGITSVAG